ncbi:hypothetical protein GGS21DRAFT_29583 [Xylaria nigripes]|nr:hypothetical protein GGS21DRAFT_29583 [Xylaria nigripes]
MDDGPPVRDTSATLHQSDTITSSRRRSGSSASIASKFPVFRPSTKLNLDDQHAASAAGSFGSENASQKQPRALATAISQQHKTRRRKSSLRKVVLLGRGAAREKRETKPQPQPQSQLQPPQLQVQQHVTTDTLQSRRQQPHAGPDAIVGKPIIAPGPGLGMGLGLGLSNSTPRQVTESSAPSSKVAISAKSTTLPGYVAQLSSPTISYTSTTDEEDGAARSLPVPLLPNPDHTSFSSSSESYFHGSSHHAQSPGRSTQRRRSTKKQPHAESTLSLQGLATGSPALGSIDGGFHDYSETEWWGWVVLIVTWLVFIIGMGSCLNIWSWAWDVGSTPYAPPELEDDPTLPIVGYYPALMILTSIMAWVWVIVAWVGMKYFRHAKISGD